ncbi:penicillin acylase family protein [Conexibacter woesei]|uniref:penicillin acylase family protein n=1 Tax=Conexibacter woesei TaxID=191495 RepID=UPI000412472E|nr:penicillin acylase family protein [Conexibacter woesei]
MLPKRAILAAAAVSVAAFFPAASSALADTTLNIVPHGEVAPGVPWASTPGILPADTQAKMYDRITPLFRNLPADVLTPSTDGNGYYKSAALLPENDPSFKSSQTVSGTSPTAGAVSATIKRDAYGVPHIYSSTDAGATFGAGYVVATDQGLLLTQARYNGIVGLIDLPGVQAIDLILGLYNFKPNPSLVKQVTDLQTKNIEAAGAQGRQLLNDIDTYLAGMNAQREATSPTTAPYTRTDIYALNAVKSQFLGEGGGNETAQALFLNQLQKKFGSKNGAKMFADLQGRNDPEAAVTTTKRFSWGGTVRTGDAPGEVGLTAGTFKNTFIRLPGARASSASARAASVGSTGLRHEASNILIVSGSKSATGKPLFVGGPQIGYNYPGLTMEMQLSSPSFNVEGVTSAPFPGYMLIGHGANYAWTLTSADGDIIDTYAETLCGGSKTKYSYKGKCKSMEKVDAGTITKGSSSVKAAFLRTVHGPVIGYAKNAKTGKLVALSQKRSSYGRETVDQLFNQDLTYGRVHSASDFIKAAAKTPQTFNSFYASDTQSAFYTAGALPKRASGVNPELPVDGRGSYEWRGELKSSQHPQVVNPSSGYIVNWNNKPAAGWPASDSRFGSEGGIQRVNMLNGELRRYPKATLLQVLASANAAATEDVRETQFWPTLKKMLAKGKSPSAQATAIVKVLDDWYTAGGSRVDSNLDGKIDNPGAIILDTAWKKIATAGLCDKLGSAACASLSALQPIASAPPGGQYSGWHQYMWKDFRTELGQSVKGKYSTKYCGDGSVSTCSKELWSALASAGKSLSSSQGTTDPTKWTEKTTMVNYTPLPLFNMQYTNKPTGIHQVMAFGQ